MTEHEWRQQAQLYALGVLDGDELSAFEVHLAECGNCLQEVNEHQRMLAKIPRMLQAKRPPDALREKVMKRVANEAQEARKHRCIASRTTRATCLNLCCSDRSFRACRGTGRSHHLGSNPTAREPAALQ